nr:antitoxin VbhA family protein [Klebsiella pneumoniae subsp. pneumoniae]
MAPLDPPLRDGLRGGFLALENGRGPMSTTQMKDSRRKAVNGVISSFQLEAITDEFKILLEDYINGKISTDEVLAMVSDEPTTTEYDYEITPHSRSWRGWNLRLLENGEEVGGGVFPCRSTAIFGMKRRSRRYSIASMRTP